MFSIYEFAAFGTAMSWALGSMISQYSVRHLGTFAFNRYRLVIATFILGIIVLISGVWRGYNSDFIPLAILSGFVGIFLGDAVLFASFARIGARRSSVVFATNAPMTVILGYIFLNETLTRNEILGIIITFVGVILAIIFGKRKSQISHWEEVRGPLWIGVVLALLGALGQATGSIIIRPVMEAGAAPFFTSFLRVATAAIALLILAGLAPKLTRAHNPLNKRIFSLVSLQALIGMVAGMTLLLFAFQGAPAGIVATLSATVPVLILPVLWYVSKEMPALGAWIGALLVVIGSGFIAYG